MRTENFNIYKTVGVTLLLSLILLVISSISVRGATVLPVEYDGNINCGQLGYSSGFKIDTNPSGGEYYFIAGPQNGDPTGITVGLADPNNYVTVQTDGNATITLWTSSIGIDAVIVKGGPDSNVYQYDPEVQTDTDLTTPAAGPDISHVEFCYDYEVTVSKTAVATFDREYDWTILKTVDPAYWDLFTGDTATSTFTITPTRDAGTDINFTVSGLITVHNNTPFTATITDIVDTLNVATTGGGLTDCNFDVDVLIPPGGYLYCNYSFSLGSNLNGTNTAVVSTTGDVGGGTAEADFAFETDPANEIDETATISDPQDPLGVRNADSGVSYNYDVLYTCAHEGDNENIATLTEGDTVTDIRIDDATVTIDCHDLNVSKTANTAIDLTYNWQITKDVDIPSWALFNGENATSTYTVEVSQNGAPTPSGWQVSGEITIHNPAPIDALLTDVSDTINPGGLDVTVTCPSMVVPANGGTLVCTYVKGFDSAVTGTNTATATNQNYNRPAGTPTVTTDYASPAVSFNFSNPVIDQEFNKTVNVTDIFDTLSAVEIASLTTDPNDDSSVTYPETGDTWVYSRTFECGANHTYNNTVTLLGDNGAVLGDDSESVDVTCYTPTIIKDAETTFERYWFWDLDKEAPVPTGDDSPYNDSSGPDADLGDLLLDTNQVYGINYILYLSATSTDDDHAVSGSIFIYNPHPSREMSIAEVTDNLSNGLVPTVICSATTVAPGATLECTYSAGLDDATSLQNTATVVQNLFEFDANGSSEILPTSYTSDPVDVEFDNTPDNEHNECVTVSDIQSIDLGTGTPITLPDSEVCAGDLDVNGQISISYTVDVEFAECGLHQVENTATITPTEGGTPATDTVAIYVNIECLEGCTRTIGYWKTHSDLGPAPYDETWALIDGAGALDESAQFFTSGLTYHQILWEPVQGRGYIQLAKQYIGARLNDLADTDVPPEVAAALTAAEAIFNSVDDVDDLSRAQTREARQLASLLDDYNNGLLGPLHCDEDSTSGDND